MKTAAKGAKDESGAKAAAPLRVVFLVDITGSMSRQLDGVKQMIQAYCGQSSEKISIMTYTENDKQGYTSYYTSDRPAELVAYVRELSLCKPPGHAGVNAHGGDGEENVLQGLAATSAVSLDERMLLFVITDAPPHSASQRTREAANERRKLVELGLAEDETDVDMYRVLDRVLDARRGRVAICPLMYGVSGQALHFYAQCAALTGGLLLRSSGTSDARALAATLEAVVTCVSGGSAASRLQGFDVLGLGGFEEADDEADEAARRPPAAVVDTREALLGLQKTVQTLAGRKWAKRAKAANLEGVKTALSLVLTLGQARVPDPRAFAACLEHVDAADQPFLTDAAVEAFRAAHAALAAPTAEQECIVTLESAQEAVKEASEADFGDDADKCMHVFLKLLLARLIDVQFPKDKDGNPDFMDPWSADIRHIGASTLSAFAAMKCRDAATGLYTDPQTRKDHSGVLVLAEPEDAFGSAVLRLASATPLVDLVTHYLLSGTVKLYRNIWAGSAASLLFRIMCDAAHKKTLSERGWALARSVLHSLAIQGRPVAGGVVKQLENGHANPADAVSKLLAALRQLAGRCQTPEAALFRVFASELTTGLLMQHKRLHPDAPALLAPEMLLQVPALGPEQQHPLEAGLAVALDDGWQDRAAQALRAHPMFLKSRAQLGACFALLHADVTEKDAPPLAAVPASVHEQVFLESWFLGKRSARYEAEVTPSGVTHAPLAVPPLETLAVQWLREASSKDVVEQCKRRAAFAKAELLQRAGTLAEAKDPEAALRQCTLDLAGTTYRLGRGDALALLGPGQPAAWKRAVVLGGWTTEPPSYLSRDAERVLEHFAAADRDEVAAALRAKPTCQRKQANRQGHTRENAGPGAANWTEAYARARLGAVEARTDQLRASRVAKLRSYVSAMQDCTAWVAELDTGSAAGRVLKKVQEHMDDANRLPQLQTVQPVVERASADQVERLDAMRGRKLCLRKLVGGWAEYDPDGGKVWADLEKRARVVRGKAAKRTLAPPARGSKARK